MRVIFVLMVALAAMGSAATAQQLVTPSTPLGQGFTPNGLQTTPSNPDLSAPSQQLNQGQLPTGSSGAGTFDHNGKPLNLMVAPTEAGRTIPEGPLGAPEHPEGPLR